MARIVSPVEVCNLAASQLNQRPISSIEPPDEGSEAAQAFAQWYDPSRRDVLRSHTWNFARKRGRLIPNTEVPAFGWSVAYELPTDYIREVRVEVDGQLLPEGTYEIEGNTLLCNSAGALDLLYIYDHDNPAMWSGDFLKACAMRLAENVGPQLSASEGNTRLAEARAEKAIKGARSVNGQENRPTRVEYSKLLARRQRMTNGVIRVR